MAAVAGTVIVVSAAAAWYFTHSAPPLPAVPVIVDAAPWATVSAIARADGARETLPPHASTPLALALVPGSYRVTLIGPPPESEAREVSVEVAPGSTASRVFEQFSHITPEDYFRRHVPLAGVPSAAAVSETAP